MPSINRIRVNNVKYNFGTQFYDDFTMRMHGKNTLYDLANGGGKSVLMLLLMQNMIPNCTLDEKQPIEKLFRTGNENSTIHSLVEWKLDPGDSSEGYRYMTTGFCARKAKEQEGEVSAKSDVASIEYFNYCIFYREFNKNDIVNLPLSKDGERITFQGLRNYLKDLEHRDMALMVRVFDRKGEYQRFISGYGLHESQWEIIRGINKTEGHVRTYFENNYKTTRKVVEDLLIEEIIEKAYAVKTMEDGDSSDSMAKMLMDIKEQLTVLAKKKKDIVSYDHQAELISVLADKVRSFMDLYQEQSNLSGIIADIYVTGEEFAKNDEKEMERLAKEKDEKRNQKNAQRERMECLKVSRDKKQLLTLKEEASAYELRVKQAGERVKELTEDLNKKESVNEYLLYLEDRKKYYQCDAVIKNMMAESSFDEELLYAYAYNIKMRMDVVMTDLRNQIAEIEDVLEQVKVKREYQEKLLSEAKLSLAVAEHSKKTAEEQIVELSEKLSDIRMDMNNIRFADVSEQLSDSKEELADLQSKIEKEQKSIDECQEKVTEQQERLILLRAKKADNDKLMESLSEKEQAYLEAKDKLNRVQAIYNAKDTVNLVEVISNRITDAVLAIADLKKQKKECSKNAERLAEGRLIGVSHGAAKVLDYIETRHGIQAMYGMDYISALPAEKQQEVLSANPELVYGVLVDDFDAISSDPNIREVNTGNVPIYIYDITQVSEKAMHLGDNVFSVSASAEYLTDAETISNLVTEEREKEKEITSSLAMQEEMLATYREDQDFVIRLSDSELLQAGEKLAKAKDESAKLIGEITECITSMDRLKKSMVVSRENQEKLQEEYEACLSDLNKLYTVEQLSDIISKQEALEKKATEDIERLTKDVVTLTNQADDEAVDTASAEARKKTLEDRLESMIRKWEDRYKAYYNIDKDYDVLTLDDADLEARFVAMVDAGSQDAKAIEDKRLLMDTLSVSMERTKKNIEKRGVDIRELADLEARNLLYEADEQLLDACHKNIDDTKMQLKEAEGKLREKQSEVDRLEGSIAYAIQNIQDAFGRYVEEEASYSEIVSSLENGQALLERLEREAKACEETYKRYAKQQGYMLDLYKDVKRIVTTHDISLENAMPMIEEKEKLREIFEKNLMGFDRSCKNLDRAKNELLKFKGNTATALDQMEVFELAATIRDDVVIPVNFVEAKALMENLSTMVEYIQLERDRVEKSLADMETIKANFEEQCLQRCLDVRTELDKLPKLSRILVDGEAIQMVGLQVPYVKDEFLKQRMSDYIDRVVSQADDYDQDKDRMKFIRNSLTLKKLFGVIVTDMNAIKLSLYKRERIKEQSRYLKYEEAVGSTGQSQGIYIQFLVSIINYISGMYQVGNEDTRTKTIFIDNPFGAAKDVYIWEPIFALLSANKVQLIVPARGATPAITGRFDVNYILGQQMSGGKQLTVVVDYTSKVDQQDLEYQDLEYEQVSFDFI